MHIEGKIIGFLMKKINFADLWNLNEMSFSKCVLSFSLWIFNFCVYFGYKMVFEWKQLRLKDFVNTERRIRVWSFTRN